VNLAQACDAESVPHAQTFLKFLEGAGKSTAWCLALVQFDGVLDADELNAVAAGTKAAANAEAKSAVEKWLVIGLHCVATEAEQRRQLAVAGASASPLPLFTSSDSHLKVSLEQEVRQQVT
jgi:1-aminocyclopropane-1-carboxylate deaminase/D-cysteine desulfhydrase-like pyridoxal-dependent ACC family enzyme